jgi:hypothetical protein
MKFKVDRKSLEHMYFSYVRPILEYADVVWDNCSTISLINIRNNKGPKMDPCGTPALTVFQDDSFPFITTFLMMDLEPHILTKL